MPKWEKPRILHMDSLPAGLGHCVDGSTPSAQACQNGQDTGVAEHFCQFGGQGVGQQNGVGCLVGNEVVQLACISGSIYNGF